MSNRQPIDRPLPSSFDGNDDFYNENTWQKIARKLKQEPLVPLGCILTVAAFANAYRAMRKGDHAQVNRMFRARVAAQGFTVLAIVAGGIYYGAERKKERQMWQEKRDQDAEEKKQKWIRELEARDEEDRLVREKLERRRQRMAEGGDKSGDGKTGGAVAKAVADAAAASTEEKKTNSGGWSSLGGWFGGSKKDSSEAIPPPSPEAKTDKAGK